MCNTVTRPSDPNESNRNKTVYKSEDIRVGSEQSPLAGEVRAVDGIKANFGISFKDHMPPSLDLSKLDRPEESFSFNKEW